MRPVRPQALNRGDHSSRRRVTTPLKRPTRTFGEPSRLAGLRSLRVAILPSLFGLAPCGVCHATFITERPVRSYRTFSPLPLARRYILCGTFRRTALKPPLPDVIRHTALWSSDFPPPEAHSPASRRKHSGRRPPDPNAIEFDYTVGVSAGRWDVRGECGKRHGRGRQFSYASR